jgi:NAD+ diphosphatase
MIQDIFPHSFDNQYLSLNSIGEEDIILHYTGRNILYKVVNEEPELPRKKDFPEITEKTEKIFLFTLDSIPCFLITDDLKTDKPHFVFKEINIFRTVSRQEIAWVSIAGFHLASWYEQNRFCGKCGTRTIHKVDERALVCPECNAHIFPRISPAVIMAIISNDKLLLARNSNFQGNWYSLIAGYSDIGESLEETVIREVREEVGLEISNIRYYKSQPWPLSGSMMIGFVAEADESQQILPDGNEIIEASWFSRGNLPNHPSLISIAGEMIEKFDRGEL